MSVAHVVGQFGLDDLHRQPHALQHQLMLVAYSSLLAVARTRLLLAVDRLGVGRQYVRRRVVVHLCEGWRADDGLIGHEAHILVDIDVDRRRCAVPAVGVRAIGAHVSILLEVSDRLLLSSLDFANQLVGMHLCLPLL